MTTEQVTSTTKVPDEKKPSPGQRSLLALANGIANTARSVYVALAPYRWLAVLLVFGFAPPISVLGTFRDKLAEAEADTLVKSLLDWPAMLFALLMILGPGWLREYLGSINEVAGMRRQTGPMVARSVDDAPTARAGAKEGKDEAP